MAHRGRNDDIPEWCEEYVSCVSVRNRVVEVKEREVKEREVKER